MNKHSPGFSIVELLIAMTISSFVMMGMMQGLATARRFLKKGQSIMALNRRACLAFNQLERDFNGALIPLLAKPLKDDKKDAEMQSLHYELDTKDKEKDDFEFFKGTIYEDLTVKVAGKKYEMFKNVFLVTTNVLKIYNERRPNFVRVMYELVPDKEKKVGTKIPYKLIRKETLDLKNKNLKEVEDLSKKEEHLAVKTHVIADNIKEFSIEYVVPKPQEKGKKEEAQELLSFVWGKKAKGMPHAEKKDEEVLRIPQAVYIRMALYNETLDDTYAFQTMCQILSFAATDPLKKEKKEDIEAQSKELKEEKEA